MAYAGAQGAASAATSSVRIQPMNRAIACDRHQFGVSSRHTKACTTANLHA